MMNLSNYAEILNKCSHCGYCQATCPVYLADLLESHVARNRINVINNTMVSKTMPLSERAKEIIDRCLLCTNCTQTCASQVPIDEIIIAARSQISQQGSVMSSVKKFVRNKVLTQRGLTGMLGKAGSIAQKIGIANKEMPTLTSQSFDSKYAGIISPEGEVKGKIAYFVGCGTNYIFPDTGEAVLTALTTNGYEVIIPKGQVCCGIPAIAEGDLASSLEMLKSNINVFAKLEVDAIVTDCTSCGMMFKEKYLKLISDDEELTKQVKAFNDKVFEITDYLATNGLNSEPSALKERYTYHVPCHRGWSPTVKDAPRKLLTQIPQAELQELENPEMCCGAAGTFFMNYRDLSEQIRAQRLKDIDALDVDTIVTQCPVCRFYLDVRLKDKKVIHPISLLAKAYKQ